MPETQPASPELNKPTSGSYGEKAELEELKRELPTSSAPPPEEPAGGAPPVVPFPGRDEGRPPGLPADIPAALLEGPPPLPTGTPAGPRAPVGLPDFSAAVDDRQRRIALADYYSRLETLSPRAREWFAMVKRLLLAGGD